MSACLIAFSAPANAVTCVVDTERAYQRAVENGWSARCRNTTHGPWAGVSFDQAKRIGCAGRAPPGLSSSDRYEAQFFCNNAFLGARNFRNGWRFEAIRIRGGDWTHASSPYCAVAFRFSATAGRSFRRHVSELRVSKPGGRCAAFYQEAF